jgi:hypothetical protein
MKIPVKNKKMVRDMSSGAILSVDTAAIKEYEDRCKKIQMDKDRLNRLEQEVSQLRILVEEIRNKK